MLVDDPGESAGFVLTEDTICPSSYVSKLREFAALLAGPGAYNSFRG